MSTPKSTHRDDTDRHRTILGSLDRRDNGWRGEDSSDPITEGLSHPQSDCPGDRSKCSWPELSYAFAGELKSMRRTMTNLDSKIESIGKDVVDVKLTLVPQLAEIGAKMGIWQFVGYVTVTLIGAPIIVWIIMRVIK